MNTLAVCAPDFPIAIRQSATFLSIVKTSPADGKEQKLQTIELFCLHISLCILLGGLLVRENREAIFKETIDYKI